MSRLGVPVKSLANRHHLALAHNVPVEESAIDLNSILSFGGGVDKYLAHGTAGHSEIAAALRRLSLKDAAKTKRRSLDVFILAVPCDSADYLLLAAPSQTAPPLWNLILNSHGNRHKSLADSEHHQLLMRHMPQPEEQAFGRQLASKLPAAINLEKTGRQLILFTTELPDKNQAEHIMRLAIELS